MKKPKDSTLPVTVAESGETRMSRKKLSPDHEVAKGRDRSRRTALKGLLGVGALMPFSAKAATHDDSLAKCREDLAASENFEDQVRIHPEKLKNGADIIQRVVTDPAFRRRVRANPVEMLARMGVDLSPEHADTMRRAVAENPDFLVDIVEAEKFPDAGLGDHAHVLVGVVIAIAAGISSSVEAACEEQVVPREKVARAFIKQLFSRCRI